MDIFGRIREFLAGIQFPPAPIGEFSSAQSRVYALMVQAVLEPDDPPPLRIADGDDDPDDWRGWLQMMFREIGCIRIFMRFPKWDQLRGYQLRRMRFLKPSRFLETPLPPVMALWNHWMLVAGDKYLGEPAEPALLEELWAYGFRHQGAEGPLHPRDRDGLFDAFIYDELTALHAAYNSARALNDPSKFDQVRRAVRWHVENTQPDHTTAEPWALAAFAAMDETGTFAEQQFHDAVTTLQRALPLEGNRVPLALGLLADAVLTAEESTDDRC